MKSGFPQTRLIEKGAFTWQNSYSFDGSFSAFVRNLQNLQRQPKGVCH